MTTFVVTPEVLRALQQQLLGLGAEFENAGQGELSGFPGYTTTAWGPTQFGSVNEADRILSGFREAWQSSLEVTAKSITDVAEKLGTAADDYVAVDRSCVPGSSNPAGPVSV